MSYLLNIIDPVPVQGGWHHSFLCHHIFFKHFTSPSLIFGSAPKGSSSAGSFWRFNVVRYAIQDQFPIVFLSSIHIAYSWAIASFQYFFQNFPFFITQHFKLMELLHPAILLSVLRISSVCRCSSRAAAQPVQNRLWQDRYWWKQVYLHHFCFDVDITFHTSSAILIPALNCGSQIQRFQ